MDSHTGIGDSDDLKDRLRAQEQVLRDLQLAQVRFLEKYREKMAESTPPTSAPDSSPSD